MNEYALTAYLKYIFLMLVVVISWQPANAQFYPTQYRPPNQQWQYLATPHFKIVYGKGNDTTALKMGRILETQYPKVQDLVGGHLHKFPVIFNDYNDRSNGFVSPFNFRSEIELPPTVGKVLNPQSGNWLENVGPHELVHALQFSHLGKNNLPRLVSWFSPDLARSFHGAIPSGMLEGIAVYSESVNVKANGGRGNFPMFTNQFNAVFDSKDRWSMGQMLQTSSWTRPFNRHYIGGYEFTNWLQKTYGPKTTRQALNFYMDYPFLGYGVALRHVTGLWPGQLYHRLENDKEETLKSDYTNSAAVQELEIPYRGREIRRPQWRSDSTLIFYGSFYNARPGFYQYNLYTGKLNRLLTTNAVRDYRYDISRDHASMVYSYYRASTLYDNTAKAELGTYDFETDKTRRRTKNGRLYAPFFSDDQLYALQTKPASSRLVSVKDSNRSTNHYTQILSLGSDEITAVSPNPVNKTWAVVANKRGMQALWIGEKDRLDSTLSQPPAISFDEGSIFDPEWHPDGSKLMFSSDFSGTQQIYEYDLQTHAVNQITDAPYNAFEGSYSPNGNRIALIKQIKNERLPVILGRADFLNTTVPENKWTASSDSKPASMQQPVVADSMVEASKGWKSENYSSGLSWLKPRMLLPVINEFSNRDIYETGLSLQSGNLLSNQAYSAEATYLEDRLWYDLLYKNTSFFPGFKARLYNRPSYISYSPVNSNKATNTLLRQERSLAISVPLRFRFNQNIYNTSFFLEPKIRRSQTRFLNIGSAGNSSPFTNHTITNMYGQFNYRLQQNSRDLQPNSGLVLFSEVEHYLNSNRIMLHANGENLSLKFKQPTALRGGIFTYLSPMRRWNQSLRLGLRGLTQSGLVFDNQSIVSGAFSEPILPGSPNLVSLSARYTIPLTYVDNGGFLLPLYLSNIYMVAFSNSVTDPASGNWVDTSRSVFGVGLRALFRLSNLSFDIGVGFGYEPTRGKTQVFVGDF